MPFSLEQNAQRLQHITLVVRDKYPAHLFLTLSQLGHYLCRCATFLTTEAGGEPDHFGDIDRFSCSDSLCSAHELWIFFGVFHGFPFRVFLAALSKMRNASRTSSWSSAIKTLLIS
jgi:hypothetical protein